MNRVEAIASAFEKLGYWQSKENSKTILNAYGCDLHLGHERIEHSSYEKLLSDWKPENTVYLGLMEDECNLTVDGVKELVEYLQEWLSKQGEGQL